VVLGLAGWLAGWLAVFDAVHSWPSSALTTGQWGPIWRPETRRTLGSRSQLCTGRLHAPAIGPGGYSCSYLAWRIGCSCSCLAGSRQPRVRAPLRRHVGCVLEDGTGGGAQQLLPRQHQQLHEGARPRDPAVGYSCSYLAWRIGCWACSAVSPPDVRRARWLWATCIRHKRSCLACTIRPFGPVWHAE
jgi:hypothetical protein